MTQLDFDNGVYFRKIEILELHGYLVTNIDGYDYVSEEDDLLVCVDDIHNVYEFIGL